MNDYEKIIAAKNKHINALRYSIYHLYCHLEASMFCNALDTGARERAEKELEKLRARVSSQIGELFDMSILYPVDRTPEQFFKKL